MDPVQLNANNLTLQAKYDRMRTEEVLFESYNTEGDYKGLVVSYGTMSRVCRTAIDMLKADGIEVGMIRPQTLFPFPEEALAAAAAKPSCMHVLSIEMSMGQMVEDVERCVKARVPVSWYGKCGGDIPTPEEIIDVINQRLA